MIGLRTKSARHILDEVHGYPAAETRRFGATPPLCGIYLNPRAVSTQVLNEFAPAVICPGCIAVARRWYSPTYFVTFDCVQRRRLLAALDYDLEVAAK